MAGQPARARTAAAVLNRRWSTSQQAWLQTALEDRCVPVTVGDALAALWCPSANEHQLAVIVNTGFDGSLLTLWGESGAAAFEAGYSVLVLMGPGQGES